VLTSDAFAERYGAQTCDWLETCDGSTVDRDACLADQADGVDALLALDGCSYDEDAARDCLDQREGATCEQALSAAGSSRVNGRNGPPVLAGSIALGRRVGAGYGARGEARCGGLGWRWRRRRARRAGTGSSGRT
jgi:hypothetical protein